MNHSSEKKRGKFRKLWREVINLTLRRMPSEYHAKKWLTFEDEVLVVRTQLILASRTLQSILAFFLASDSFDSSEKYLSEGGPENVELAR